MNTGPPVVWPREQSWQMLPGRPPVLLAHFADHAAYHPGLTARIMALLDDRALAKRYARVTSGTKIHHIERWSCPEADLVNARAMEFFKRALRSGTASVDLSWATVYRMDDYTAPHSHLRARASIVHCVDPNDDPRPRQGQPARHHESRHARRRQVGCASDVRLSSHVRLSTAAIDSSMDSNYSASMIS